MCALHGRERVAPQIALCDSIDTRTQRSGGKDGSYGEYHGSNGLQRRELLARMGTGLVVLTIHSAWGEISPAEARARGIPLRHFSATEGQTLEALADALLPGPAKQG